MSEKVEVDKQVVVDLVNKFSIGDFIYNIRERAVSTMDERDDEDNLTKDAQWWKNNPMASSWDHPLTVRYGECVTKLKESL